MQPKFSCGRHIECNSPVLDPNILSFHSMASSRQVTFGIHPVALLQCTLDILRGDVVSAKQVYTVSEDPGDVSQICGMNYV